MPENIFYRAKRTAAALFSRRCVSCGKTFSGKQCLCAECTKKLKPVKSFFCEEYLACAAYSYEAPARDVMLRFKFNDDYESCIDTLSDWLCAGFDKYLSDESFSFGILHGGAGFATVRSCFSKSVPPKSSTGFPPENAAQTSVALLRQAPQFAERKFCLLTIFIPPAAPCANVPAHFARQAQARFAFSRC